jgi:hypothetical protein
VNHLWQAACGSAQSGLTRAVEGRDKGAWHHPTFGVPGSSWSRFQRAHQHSIIALCCALCQVTRDKFCHVGIPPQSPPPGPGSLPRWYHKPTMNTCTCSTRCTDAVEKRQNKRKKKSKKFWNLWASVGVDPDVNHDPTLHSYQCEYPRRSSVCAHLIKDSLCTPYKRTHIRSLASAGTAPLYI